MGKRESALTRESTDPTCVVDRLLSIALKLARLGLVGPEWGASLVGGND
jgi:hypothetical protein